MDIQKKFKIPFTGLKEGKHMFEFTAKEEFFEHYRYDFVDNVDLLAKAHLHKRSTMMILDLNLSGNYTTQCDRCGDDLVQDFDTDNRVYFKFGSEESEDDDIFMLNQSVFEIELAELIFEFFVTSISLSHIHQEGDCNKEVIQQIEEFRVKEQKNESNPIWDKLKDLK